MSGEAFDPFQNLVTTLEECPLCGQGHQSRGRLLEGDPEGWTWEIECGVRGEWFKAREGQHEREDRDGI